LEFCATDHVYVMGLGSVGIARVVAIVVCMAASVGLGCYVALADRVYLELALKDLFIILGFFPDVCNLLIIISVIMAAAIE